MATLVPKKLLTNQAKKTKVFLILGSLVIFALFAAMIFAGYLIDCLSSEIRQLRREHSGSIQRLLLSRIELWDEIFRLQSILLELGDLSTLEPDPGLYNGVHMNMFSQEYLEEMIWSKNEVTKKRPFLPSVRDSFRKLKQLDLLSNKSHEEVGKPNQAEIKQLKDLISSYVNIDHLKALESYYDDKLLNFGQEIKEQKEVIQEMKELQLTCDKMREITQNKLEGLQEFTFKVIKDLQKEKKLDKKPQNFEREKRNEKQGSIFEIENMLRKALNAYEAIQEGGFEMNTFTKLKGVLDGFNLFSGETNDESEL